MFEMESEIPFQYISLWRFCGQGLSIPLKSFSIDIDKYENIKVIIDKEHMFKRFNVGLGYKMAVCSLNKEISNNIIMIDQSSLINNYSKFDMA